MLEINYKPIGIIHSPFKQMAGTPNPIGISVVRLMRIEKDRLFFRDVDMIDGTPLLDIKPHFVELDSPKPERTGWLENNVYKLSEAVTDGRV